MGDTLNSLNGLGLWLAFGGLAVMAVLALIVSRRSKRRGAHGVAAGHRLAVLDQVPIDQTRRLVLIQRDEVQHLVILGGGSDFLVESGIRSGEPRLETGHHTPHHEPQHRPVFLDEPRREPPLAPETPGAPTAMREPEPRPLERPPVERVIPERPAAREPLFRPAAPRRPVTNVKPAEPVAPTAAAEPRLDIAPEPVTPPPARPRAPARPDTKAEPRLDPVEKPEGGRVAVKLDPFFAGMVEQLEETLRRPTAAGEAARSATVTATTVTVTATPPAAAPSVAEAPILDVAPSVVAPAVTAPTAGAQDAPAAAVPEILPPLTADDEPPAARAAAAPPVVVAPTAQDRPATPSEDPFEIEMASLLGRNRRT